MVVRIYKSTCVIFVPYNNIRSPLSSVLPLLKAVRVTRLYYNNYMMIQLLTKIFHIGAEQKQDEGHEKMLL